MNEYTKFELTKEQEEKLAEWLVVVTQRAAKMQEELERDKRPGLLESMQKRSDLGLLSEKGEAMLSRLKKPLPRPLPYYGDEGGGISFTFRPTTSGVYCRVTERITGNFIDLDDLGWG